MAFSLFNLRASQSSSTISLHVFFGIPLDLVPSTSYSIHFFTQSLSSFRRTCPYHRNLFCCSTEIMSHNRSEKLAIPHLTSSPLGRNLLSKYHYINRISTEFQYPLWLVHVNSPVKNYKSGKKVAQWLQ